MKKLKRSTLFFAFILLSGLFACEKEGPIGPAGEQGIVGPQGAKGDKGSKGAKGDPGTANVMYSDWIDIEWDLDAQFKNQMYLTVPQITKAFIDGGGVVLLYLKFHLSSGLDVISFVPNEGTYFTVYLNHPSGYSIIFTQPTPDPILYRDLEKNHTIMYVLIPGGVNVKALQDINLENYDELVMALNAIK